MALVDPELDSGNDPNTNPNAPQPPAASAPYYGPMAPGVTPGPGEGDAQHNPNFGGGDFEKQIRDQYQKAFGRGPDANELATDIDAAKRYGLTSNGPTGGVLGQIASRSNNIAGSGNLGNPTGPIGPRVSSATGAFPLPNRNDPRVATSEGYNAPGLNYPGSQFSDPYTKLLEDIAHNQLNLLQGNNPQTQQLMDFINKQFGALSQSNGYTPDEFALLRTQAMEPIMAGRDAAQQRELERTARAGYLPTSGITLDQQRQIDTDYGKMTTAASRDLAINGINRQDQQRSQAIQLGQMGMQIPQQQGAQALDVAGMLYQLPRQAMLDANTIVNGSAPQNAISPYIQLLQQQQQAQYQQQYQNQLFWENIGTQLAKLFGG